MLPALANPEHELKFVLPNAHTPVVERWLEACCQPHPEFPAGWISSIYYDSPDWGLLNEKINSDYYKRKVRLRWYRRPTGELHQAAFIEEKAKAGCFRHKSRVKLPQKAEFWAGEPLGSDAHAEVLKLLEKEGGKKMDRLQPVFQIGYYRRRYLHPFCHSVICLDSNIRVERVNERRMKTPPLTPITHAVLEHKSPLDRLDPVLEGLSRFGLRKSAFSKYEHCYLHLTGNTFN